SGIVLGADPRKHPGLLTAQRRGVDAGPFKGLPSAFQQQPLLGVGGKCLAGADRKELGVKLTGVIEETALAGIAGAGVVGVGVIGALGVPAAVAGKGGDRVPSLGQ